MRAHFFFLTGIISFLGSAFFLFGPAAIPAGFFLCMVALCMGLALLWLPKKMRIYAAFILIGVLGTFVLARIEIPKWQTGMPYILEHAPVMVVGYPEEKSFYQEVILTRTDCKEDNCNKNILWQAPRTLVIGAGEQFYFSCRLEAVKNFSPEFDYKMFLAKEGIGYVCAKGEKNEEKEVSPGGSFRMFMGKARLLTERALTRTLPEPELGLAKGLILGGSNYLSDDLEEDFQRVGMTHIVAVSGYNILLVAGILLFVATTFGVWKKTALYGALLGVVLFILFVGAPASAVRAGAMAGLSFGALLSGRKSVGFIVLLVSAVGMLLVNPLLLYYDIGFQLSFLALLGILFALPEQSAPHKKGFLKMLGEAIRVTFWVELFVLPVIVHHFGIISWFSLVANVLLIPLIPLAMLGSVYLILCGLIAPTFLVSFFALPVYICLWLIITFVEYFGAQTHIVFEHLYISPGGLFVWYSVLISYGVLQLRHTKKKWYAKAFVVDSTIDTRRTDIF